MWCYEYPDYLAHHGIKGMKWGVRRYQNKDGSLTVAGRKREAYLKAKENSNGLDTTKLNYLKREYKDAATYEELSSKEKSKHQLKLEEKFKAKGYSTRDAEIAAYNRVKTEKRVAVVAGVTAASLVAYAGYKHYDRVTDKILKEGSELGRVTLTKDEPLDRAFYAYNNKHDEKRYVGLYGHQLNQQAKVRRQIGLEGTVYKKTMALSKDIKVASPESARKVLSETLTDDQKKNLARDFRIQARNNSILGITKRASMYEQAAKDVSSGKVTSKVYDAFNASLPAYGRYDLGKNYYSNLKKAGYGAIRDVNDHKYSGYDTKNPVIVFDGSNINVEKVSTLGENICKKQNLVETNKLAIKNDAGFIAAVGGMVVATMGINHISNKAARNRYVDNYYKEHPNSAKSRNELIKDYEDSLDS